jgi:hypothetical protein
MSVHPVMLWAVFLAMGALSQAHMILKSVSLADGPPLKSKKADGSVNDKDPFGYLRGIKRGDIWGPPEAGANRLPCGAPGNKWTSSGGDRGIRLAAGQEYKFTACINGRCNDSEGPNIMRPDDDPEHTHAPGNLTFEIKYGPSTNFQDPYEGVRLQPYSLPLLPQTRALVIFSSSIPRSPSWNGEATIQVAYRMPNITYYQCIDIMMDGEEDLPDFIPPQGLPAPEPNDDGDIVKARSTTFVDNSGDLNTFHIIMIVLLIIIICLIICVILKYKSGKDDDDEEDEFEPEIEPQEKVQPKPVERKVYKEPTPPPKADTPEDRSRSLTPEKESEEEEESEDIPEPVDPGSKGRHFHFRYVEDNDD